MNRKIILSTLALAALLISGAVAGPQKKAWLGVYTQAVDNDLADAFDLSVKYGAIVNSVVEDSPAEKAGIKEDDIIIEINGQRITDDVDLQYTIQDSNPGDEVSIVLMRDGEKVELTATLDKYSSRNMRNGWKYYTRQGSKWNSPPYKVTVAPGVEHSYIGVELTDVSRGVAKSLGADDAGVLVNEVEKDSPAEKAGLLPGDLIVMIDGDEVGESTEVSEIIRSFDEGEKVKLDVIRERKKMNIEVEVGRTEYGSNAPYMFSLPDMPNIDINIPRMKGLHWLNFDDEMFDSDDFKDDMKELRKELEELRLELNELRGDKD